MENVKTAISEFSSQFNAWLDSPGANLTEPIVRPVKPGKPGVGKPPSGKPGRPKPRPVRPRPTKPTGSNKPFTKPPRKPQTKPGRPGKRPRYLKVLNQNTNTMYFEIICFSDHLCIDPIGLVLLEKLIKLRVSNQLKYSQTSTPEFSFFFQI